MAGAALFPQAAMRSAGAVRDFSDSSLIVRLTRGRGWIAVLCALLGGIVALNVLSLSLTAGSGRTSLQIDELKTQVSGLQAQIEEKLSASKVEAEALRLGLANPDPKAITFLRASDADAGRVAHLLATDGFLLAPSLPSSSLRSCAASLGADSDDEPDHDDDRDDPNHRGADDHHATEYRRSSEWGECDLGQRDVDQRHLERIVDGHDRGSGALGP